MLLVYKEHAILMVSYKGREFRAYISEAHMAYWVRHCANTKVMVRAMKSA